jgi:Hint domain
MSNRKIQSSTRREFFRVAATAAGSIPLLVSSSRRVSAHWRDEHCDDPDPSACFFRGTRLHIDEREVRIEELTIGDNLKVHRGGYLPVKWIGRRQYKYVAGSVWSKELLPIRIARHALDGETPHSDLYVSPKHRIFVDGVLIPASHLINDVSIVQTLPEGVEDIEYYHVEFDTHEVIYAEGAAVESMLVTSAVENFDNFPEYEQLYGVGARRVMAPYAPIAWYPGGRSELKALLRRVASPIVDIRDPIQIAYDRIAERAMDLAA